MSRPAKPRTKAPMMKRSKETLLEYRMPVIYRLLLDLELLYITKYLYFMSSYTESYNKASWKNNNIDTSYNGTRRVEAKIDCLPTLRDSSNYQETNTISRQRSYSLPLQPSLMTTDKVASMPAVKAATTSAGILLLRVIRVPIVRIAFRLIRRARA